jgi:hypothetical protein
VFPSLPLAVHIDRAPARPAGFRVFRRPIYPEHQFQVGKTTVIIGFSALDFRGFFEQAAPGGAPTQAHCGEKEPAHRPRPPPGEAGMGAVRSSKRRTIGRHNDAVSSGRPRHLRPVGTARRGCPTPKSVCVSGHPRAGTMAAATLG